MVDISGYEGIYAITSCGRVWSYRKQKFLKGAGNPKYLYVELGHGNKKYIHRLVAEAYLPNPENLPCVNHKDENPQNNSINNLEWCSYQYNNIYGHRIEKTKITKSKRSN
jgi:hypothetical protein